MLLLKACPHCHGDLVYEHERTFGYLMCLQCGHVVSAAQERALGLRVTSGGIVHPLPPAHAPGGEHAGHHPHGRQ